MMIQVQGFGAAEIPIFEEVWVYKVIKDSFCVYQDVFID